MDRHLNLWRQNGRVPGLWARCCSVASSAVVTLFVSLRLGQCRSMAAPGMGSCAPIRPRYRYLDGRRDSRQGFMDRQKVPQNVSFIFGIRAVTLIPARFHGPLATIDPVRVKPSLHIQQNMCRKSTIFPTRSSSQIRSFMPGQGFQPQA
jgi:hypothetical protein